MAMVVNPRIIELDVTLKARSNQAVSGLKMLDKKTVEQHHQTVRRALRPEEDKLLEAYDESIFKKLKTWRTKLAAAQSVPAYVILPDKTLKLIAAILPKDAQQLSRLAALAPKSWKNTQLTFSS